MLLLNLCKHRACGSSSVELIVLETEPVSGTVFCFILLQRISELKFPLCKVCMIYPNRLCISRLPYPN